MSTQIRSLDKNDRGEIKECLIDFITFISSLENKKYDTGDIFLNGTLDTMFDQTTSLETKVAIHEGRVCGFISYFSGYWIEDNTKVCFVSAFSVLPEYRSIGVGKDLFEQLSAEMTSQGYDEIALTVHNNNEKARKFYERFGAYIYDKESMMLLRLR